MPKRKAECSADETEEAKLAMFGLWKGTSRNALETIVKTLRETPLVAELMKDRRCADGFLNEHKELETKLQVPMSGESWAFDIARTLQKMIAASPWLEGLYDDALERNKSVWKMVVAFDEFTPGAALHGKHKKKMMLLHVNFLELGAEALTNTSAWISSLCPLTEAMISRVCVCRSSPYGLSVSGLPLCMCVERSYITLSCVHM